MHASKSPHSRSAHGMSSLIGCGRHSPVSGSHTPRLHGSSRSEQSTPAHRSAGAASIEPEGLASVETGAPSMDVPAAPSPPGSSQEPFASQSLMLVLAQLASISTAPARPVTARTFALAGRRYARSILLENILSPSSQL